MRPLTEKDKKFLETYDMSKYPRPSVTADIVVFTLNPKGDLCVLMIQRKDENNIYGGCWALPGGFMNIDEDIDTTAMRELEEETNLRDTYVAKYDKDIRGTGIPLTQIGTFGEVDHDPRGRRRIS